MIAIIDYGAGNVTSVQNALKSLGAETILTSDKEQIRMAEKVVFPGVGDAAQAMKALEEKNLVEFIPTLQQPFLGVCLGAQILCSYLEEGNCQGLGVFDLAVKAFPKNGLDRVPHMGWNNHDYLKQDALTNDVALDADFYFVHGYYIETGKATIGGLNYVENLSSIIHQNNFYGVQFHPEKSGENGRKILQNFLAL